MRITSSTLVISASLGVIACTGGTKSTPAPPSSSAPHSSFAAADEQPVVTGEVPDASGRSYDVATVETTRGRVLAVERIRPGRGRSGGVHLSMSTERGETISVHLGPAWFLDTQALTVQVGDALEVTGSRVTSGGAPALIARTVVKGDQTLVLRDEGGVPRWSAGGRRAGTPPASAGAGPAASKTDVPSVLNETERRALLDALDDEYRAWATYDQVVRDYGLERPFINIREAEATHIEMLRALFESYEVAIPENSWPGRVSRFASTREACEAGIEAEVANAALYERLMRNTRRQDILTVFGYLKRASQEHHLPAFRRCATRGPGRP